MIPQCALSRRFEPHAPIPTPAACSVGPRQDKTHSAFRFARDKRQNLAREHEPRTRALELACHPLRSRLHQQSEWRCFHCLDPVRVADPSNPSAAATKTMKEWLHHVRSAVSRSVFAPADCASTRADLQLRDSSGHRKTRFERHTEHAMFGTTALGEGDRSLTSSSASCSVQISRTSIAISSSRSSSSSSLRTSALCAQT